MSLLTVDEILPYEERCVKLLNNSAVRFAGIINNKGRLLAGGFKYNIKPYEEEEERRRMLFMQLVLDLSMRKEYDNTLGSIRSITSRREKVLMTTIPIGENLLLISSEPYANTEKIVTKAYGIFQQLIDKRKMLVS